MVVNLVDGGVVLLEEYIGLVMVIDLVDVWFCWVVVVLLEEENWIVMMVDFIYDGGLMGGDVRSSTSYHTTVLYGFFQVLSNLHLVLIFSLSNVEAKKKELDIYYYYYTCPKVFDIVRDTVVEAIKNETRNGASLLRLHFHDCFVNGCDGSVLLDDNSTFKGEKTAFPNDNSLRGFEVVDLIKFRLEKACPLVVSCADILAIAARDSVYHLGGPTWDVKLGRRDSLTANITAANIFIPSPASNITILKSNFAAVGLSFKDMVALSGAHTIGFARCITYRQRIYNDSNISPPFEDSMRKKVPQSWKRRRFARNGPQNSITF
ncbi:Peroxidase 4 [Bienertia sinuspersici]